MKKFFTVATHILVAVGLVSNAYFMLTNGEPDKLWWWPLAFGFFAWSAVPFAGIVIAARYCISSLISRALLFLTALVVACGGIYILVEAFITHLDPQSGIIFIFLPFYQCVAMAIGVGVSHVTKKLGEKSPQQGAGSDAVNRAPQL